MPMQPSMERVSSLVNVSNATTCASATAPKAGGSSNCLEVISNQDGVVLICISTCLIGQQTSIDNAQSCIACVHVQSMGRWFQLLDLLLLCFSRFHRTCDEMRPNAEWQDTTSRRPRAHMIKASSWSHSSSRQQSLTTERFWEFRYSFCLNLPAIHNAYSNVYNGT